MAQRVATPAPKRAEKASDNLSRWFNVRISRRSMRLMVFDRTRMLASDATTPNFTSNVMAYLSGMAYEFTYNSKHSMQSPAAFRVTKVAEADFPTRFGFFRIYGFERRSGAQIDEAVVLKMGDLTAEGAPPPLVRIHSECLTGDVFHS